MPQQMCYSVISVGHTPGSVVRTWGTKSPRWHFVGTPEQSQYGLRPLVRCCLPSPGT